MANLINRLPYFLQQIREFKEIMESEQIEMNTLNNNINTILNNQFILSADSLSLKRYENILGIISKDTDTISDKKFKIITRLTEERPYTYERLKKSLTTLCGDDGYTISLDNETYKLTIGVELTQTKEFEDVNNLLNRTVPANIIINLGLIYNQYFKFETYTYDELTSYTYEQLRSEVI